jgi:hypothetical protein
VLSYRPLIPNGVLIATLLLFEHRRKSVYDILRIANGMQSRVQAFYTKGNSVAIVKTLVCPSCYYLLLTYAEKA